MIGEIVTLVIMVTLIIVLKQMFGMLLEHLKAWQIRDQDHQERMRVLAHEHAQRVAELAPRGAELEIRAVHVEIRSGSLEMAMAVIAALEMKNP